MSRTTETIARDLLAPMPEEEMKRHPQGGYAYYEFGDVARRVIDATGNVFSWEVVGQGKDTDAAGRAYWWVHGRLTIPTLGARDGIGVHLPQGGARNYMESESIKGAETDAFKRAAVKFGVALELYDKDRYPISDTQQARRPREERGGTPAAVWHGPGLCPHCHAPAGKRHASACELKEPGRDEGGGEWEEV